MATRPAVGEPANYFGEIVTGASGSIAVTITLRASSGTCPAAVQAYVSATCTGCTYPERQIEFSWDFGDSGGAETFTCPVTGESLNANSDQKGHLGTYVYRSAGTYTIRVTARLWTGSAWLTGTGTATYTASAWSGTDMYFDSAGGSDSNDGLTSGAPKQTFSAIKTFLEGGGGRRAMCKAGSTWTHSSTITIPVTTGTQIVKYSSGANPVFTSSTASDMFARANGAVNNVVFSYVKFDGNDTGNTINWGNTQAFSGLLRDNNDCVKGHSSGSGGTAVNGATALTSSGVVIWNSQTTASTTTVGTNPRHYWEIGDWFSVVGSSTGNGGSNPSHHFYVFKMNSLMFWCHDFIAPTDDINGRNCIRYGCGDKDAAEGPRNTSRLLFSRVNFRNQCNMLALSGTSSVVADGAITKAVVQLCKFKPLASLTGAKGGINNANCTELTIRDCVFAFTATSNDFIRTVPSDLACNLRFYRNRMWTNYANGNFLIDLPSYTGSGGLVEDNSFVLAGGSDSYFYTLNFTINTSYTFRRNRYYRATGTAAFYDEGTTAYKTLAQWQASTGTPDADASSADPGWLDPENLSFDTMLALADSSGVIRALDGDSYALGQVSALTSLGYRLHNVGTDSVALTAGTLTGAGVNSPSLPSFSTTVYPKSSKAISFVAGPTTSGAAALSVATDEAGSPFTSTITFSTPGGVAFITPASFKVELH